MKHKGSALYALIRKTTIARTLARTPTAAGRCRGRLPPGFAPAKNQSVLAAVLRILIRKSMSVKKYSHKT
jgi:hypothetical protein